MKLILLLTIFILTSCATTPPLSRMFKSDFDKLPFELPIEFSCNGSVVKTQGVGVCQQPEGTDSWLKFKLPPNEGQFRATDCKDNLQPITDFNYMKKRTGFFWIFKHTPLPDDNYTLNLGKLTSNQNECPIVVSLAGKETGIQKAIMYYNITSKDNPAYDLEVVYECVHLEKRTENGLGKCYRYSKSPFYFYVPVKKEEKGVISATAPNCMYKNTQTFENTDKVEFKIPEVYEGYCPLEIVKSVSTPEGIVHKRAAIKIVSIDPEVYGIDTPHFLPFGGKIKVWKPLFAETLQISYYDKNGKLIDSEKVDSGYKLDNDDSYFKICAFAYSNERKGAFSQACLTWQQIKELLRAPEIGKESDF